MSCYLTDLGLINALGASPEEVWRNVVEGQTGLSPCDWIPGRSTFTAPVKVELPPVPDALLKFDSRNARLALASLAPLQARVAELVERYGRARIAVVAGTSTSGIAEGEAAVRAHKAVGHKPEDYHYAQQEIGNLGELVARHLSLAGPAYTLSTACSSSAHALGSARRLVASGMVDAVVAGGTDSLCRLTVNGFSALESVASGSCSPFSRRRSGINIGEASAFFVVTREPVAASENIRLLGVGASSDAHHISAPEPNGTGAEAAIRQALEQASLPLGEIDYVNLHGTGTPLNDRMEAGVISRLFGHELPCSSSKGQLGHTLGAAGATEAALCWLALSRYNVSRQLPPHVWDGDYDPDLPPLNLVKRAPMPGNRPRLLSNSFAFGGNNAAVILGGPE